MSAFWSDFLTTAAALFIMVTGTLYPPLALIFIAALLTALAAGWVKDEIRRRHRIRECNQPPSKPISRQ